MCNFLSYKLFKIRGYNHTLNIQSPLRPSEREGLHLCCDKSIISKGSVFPILILEPECLPNWFIHSISVVTVCNGSEMYAIMSSVYNGHLMYLSYSLKIKVAPIISAMALSKGQKRRGESGQSLSRSPFKCKGLRYTTINPRNTFGSRVQLPYPMNKVRTKSVFFNTLSRKGHDTRSNAYRVQLWDIVLSNLRI